MYVWVMGVADRVTVMRCYLTESVQIQLSDEACDVPRFKDGIPPVEVLLLEPLVVEEDGGAVLAPLYGPAFAFVHDPPELLRKSQRQEYAIVVHVRCGTGSVSSPPISDARRDYGAPGFLFLSTNPIACLWRTKSDRITATIFLVLESSGVSNYTC